MSLKYAVIGTGALGGYYGGKLANVGNEVHFLFHSDYDCVKKNGLQVDSVNGNVHLSNVLAYASITDMPKCDIILVCLKSINNNLLKGLLPPLLHKDSVVILIQNGLGVEEDLQKDFPGLNIAGGLAFICSSKVAAGHIAHMDYGNLSIGSYSCTDLNILNKICTDFREAGVSTEIVDLQTARWKKLIWNIPFNGMTVALNTSTDRLVNNPDTEKLLHAMMLEVIRAANKIGTKEIIPEIFAEKMIGSTKKMIPYSPSMKLDYDFKRQLEIYYIYTRPVEEAKKYGFDMSLTWMLEKQLHFIQSQYL